MNSRKAQEEQDKMGEWRRTWPYLREYAGFVLLLIGLVTLGETLTLVAPLVLKFLIDNAILPKDIHLFIILTICYILVTPLTSASELGQQYVHHRLRQKLTFGIRKRLFAHIMALDMAYHTAADSGTLLSRLNEDTRVFAEEVSGALVTLIAGGVLLAGSVGITLWLEWRMVLFVLPFAVLLSAIMPRFNSSVERKEKVKMDRHDNLMHLFHEVLAGIRLIKLTSAESHENQQHRDRNVRFFKAELDSQMSINLYRAFIAIIVFAAPAIVIGYGGYQVIQGALTLGALMALLSYTGRIVDPMRLFAGVSMSWRTGLVSLDRIEQVLHVHPQLVDKPGAVDMADPSGNLTFRNVSFSYEDEGGFTLHDMTLEVQAGQRVALVGRSGAGKTTIAGLLCRLYDPTSGSIELDGQDIRDLTISSLRRTIGVVDQACFLFNMSVLDNIRYGHPEATEEDVMKSAIAANIHTDIMGLPEGYATVVGERGARLSGGQQQRLTIARTILRNPAILILDEATSAADSESEKLIRGALEALMEGRTTLLITHRISSITNADIIVTMDSGRVVEIGTHSELLRRQGLYAELHSSWG